jgi:flagellar hook assembly protein FlgD
MIPAYPNPFRPATSSGRVMIQFARSSSPAVVTIMNDLGIVVRRLPAAASGGHAAASWDGRDADGNAVVPGIYHAAMPGAPAVEVVIVR